MTDEQRLLELIEDGLVAHGGDLGGWTRRTDDALQLFDGRVTLRTRFEDPGEAAAATGAVHSHIVATLHEFNDEELDACVFGMGEGREASLQQAALIWISGVAGPIKSFLDDRPVCMTCQPGVRDRIVADGCVRGDYGLGGVRAFVGPAITRFFDDDRVNSALDDTKPWFRYAAESAAPRRVHLAKSVILSQDETWRRDLEVDGHDVSYRETDWPAGVAGPKFGYLTRFAVFEFPHDSDVIARRAEVDRAVRHFAASYTKFQSIDALVDDMVRVGFDADLAHDVESISTIAFGRSYFERTGVQYSPTIIRARRDGRIEQDVPLMSIPAYARARAIAEQLRETMPQNEFQAVCCYNAESNAIISALEQEGAKLDLSGMVMYPSVVPERGVSDATMDKALALLNRMVEAKHSAARKPDKKRNPSKKPWWKFW